MALAVVLLSGGLDSATVLAVARAQGFSCYALTFDYGQRHHVELAAAARVAAQVGVAGHVVVKFDLRAFGGSALTSDIPVPHRAIAPAPAPGPATGAGTVEEAGDEGPVPAEADAIPITYVPARNTIFLSFALAWAEVLGSQDIFIGVNAVDYSGYPDCRPEYIRAYEAMAALATKAGVEGSPVRVHAPLSELTKAQVVQWGRELGVDYALTHSCYDPGPDGRPCGTCDTCVLRAKGFREAGMADPALSSR
jgi:7-cyano-7-deazaguanine synthase